MEETEKGRQLKETQPLFLFTKGEWLCFIGLGQKLWRWIKATKIKKQNQQKAVGESVGPHLHIQIPDGPNQRVFNKRTMGQMLAIYRYSMSLIS